MLAARLTVCEIAVGGILTVVGELVVYLQFSEIPAFQHQHIRRVIESSRTGLTAIRYSRMDVFVQFIYLLNLARVLQWRVLRATVDITG